MTTATFFKHDEHYVGVRSPFELKDDLKRTFGARWVKEKPRGGYWRIPVVHIRELMTRLKAAGVTMRMDDQTYKAEVNKLLLANEAVADLMFKMDIEDWEDPPMLEAELRGYQKVAVAILGLYDGGLLLADPTGTGKTIICITDLLTRLKPDAPDQFLFLVPATLKFNILQQIMRHAPALAELTTVIHGTRKQRELQWAEPTPVKIAGYESYLRTDWDIAPHEWERVYADEISKLKNYRAQLHKKAIKIYARAGIIGMTATPIEIRLEELYGVSQPVRPGLLGNWGQFAKEFLETDFWGTVTGYQNTDKMATIIAPYFIRREKKKLLPQMPKKNQYVIEVEMTPGEDKEYRMLGSNFLGWMMQAGSFDSSLDPLVQMLRLRQFLDSPSLIRDGDPVNSKMLVLEAIVENAGEKIVVFTQWATMARLLHAYLPDSYMVTGQDVPDARKRLELVNKFNEDNMPLLITTDALAYGLDITGASTIVHYDMLYNPGKMEEQREGRLYRIGQNSVVNAITLVTQKSLEVWQHNLLRERKALADNVYEKSVGAMLRKLSPARMEAILRGEA